MHAFLTASDGAVLVVDLIGQALAPVFGHTSDLADESAPANAIRMLGTAQIVLAITIFRRKN